MRRFFLMIVLFLVGCTPPAEGSPPPVSIEVDGSTYETVLGSYSWSSRGLFSSAGIDADADSPFNIAIGMEPIIVEKNSTVKIITEDNPLISVYIWNESIRDYEVVLNDNQLQVPDEAGRYVYEVSAKWNQGKGSYTFVLEVE